MKIQQYEAYDLAKFALKIIKSVNKKLDVIHHKHLEEV
jgi:proline racemase